MIFEPEVLNYLKSKTICLIGFMGCGKTYLGEKLARILEVDYLDTDNIIEKKTDKSIFDIFEQNGENAFRELEKELIQDIVFTKLAESSKQTIEGRRRNAEEGCGSLILSLGGGLPLKRYIPKILKYLDPIFICLNPPFEVIMQRIKEKKRPLTYKRKREYIFYLWKDRYPIYQKLAHITIPDVEEEDILKTLNDRVKMMIQSL